MGVDADRGGTCDGQGDTGRTGACRMDRAGDVGRVGGHSTDIWREDVSTSVGAPSCGGTQPWERPARELRGARLWWGALLRGRWGLRAACSEH